MDKNVQCKLTHTKSAVALRFTDVVPVVSDKVPSKVPPVHIPRDVHQHAEGVLRAELGDRVVQVPGVGE